MASLQKPKKAGKPGKTSDLPKLPKYMQPIIDAVRQAIGQLGGNARKANRACDAIQAWAVKVFIAGLENYSKALLGGDWRNEEHYLGTIRAVAERISVSAIMLDMNEQAVICDTIELMLLGRTPLLDGRCTLTEAEAELITKARQLGPGRLAELSGYVESLLAIDGDDDEQLE